MQRHSAHSTWRHKLVDGALGIAGLVNLALGSWRMFTGDQMLSVAGLTAGLILLLASTVDRFEFLKGLGIEAKTRELDRKIDAAEEILAKVNKVAQIFSPAILELTAKAGRWDSGTPPRDAYNLSRGVKELLELVGASPADVRAALQTWARFAAIDLGFHLMRTFDRALQPSIQAVEARMQAFPRPIDAADPAYVAANEELAALRRYQESMRDIGTWKLDDFKASLKAVLDARPASLPLEVLGEFSSGIARWSPELRHLASHLDYRNPDAWITTLERDRER